MRSGISENAHITHESHDQNSASFYPFHSQVVERAKRPRICSLWTLANRSTDSVGSRIKICLKRRGLICRSIERGLVHERLSAPPLYLALICSWKACWREGQGWWTLSGNNIENVWRGCILQIFLHKLLGTAGSHDNTPAFEVRETVLNCTPFVQHRHSSILPMKESWTHLWDFYRLSQEILQICQVWETRMPVCHIPTQQNVVINHGNPLSISQSISQYILL